MFEWIKRYWLLPLKLVNGFLDDYSETRGWLIPMNSRVKWVQLYRNGFDVRSYSWWLFTPELIGPAKRRTGREGGGIGWWGSIFGGAIHQTKLKVRAHSHLPPKPAALPQMPDWKSVKSVATRCINARAMFAAFQSAVHGWRNNRVALLNLVDCLFMTPPLPLRALHGIYPYLYI